MTDQQLTTADVQIEELRSLWKAKAREYNKALAEDKEKEAELIKSDMDLLERRGKALQYALDKHNNKKL